MTPGARIAAAIEILDRWHSGTPAEQALTNWGRANRFAGSKDRAAIRDLVFDVLRRARSTAWAGGAETGRGHLIGLLRQQGTDPATLFTGEGYAPPALSPAEAMAPRDAAPDPVALDWPDWLWHRISTDLGQDRDPVLEALRHRAPVTLRTNMRLTDPETLMHRLAAEGISAAPNPLSPAALDITVGARGLVRTASFAEGLFEMQDAASQAVVDRIPLMPEMRVLDYCAGGGGKTLALAARGITRLTAHDADAGRLRDLPARAARAGATVEIATPGNPGQGFDIVLVDAPCSGSGAWRRAPEGKWRLTPDRLAATMAIQDDILDEAAGRTAPDGRLVYATCSLLTCENEDRVTAFLERNPAWTLALSQRFSPLEGGDGFYTAHLTRA